MSDAMRKARNNYRMVRIKRQRFTNAYRYIQTMRPHSNGVRACHVERNGSFVSWPTLIETVNWIMRPKRRHHTTEIKHD